VIQWQGAVLACVFIGLASVAAAEAPPPGSPEAKQEAERLNKLPPVAPPHSVRVDHSGRKEKGKASFYASRFAHQKMADGRRMNPNSNVAASKSLPLGSVAKVTNLENGKTATVKVEDRGPYVDGRVVDVSPKVAEHLDLKHTGVAPVMVKPVTVPQPDGSIKLGAGAADATPQEVRHATEATKALIGDTAVAAKAPSPDRKADRKTEQVAQD
jgi:rare lipoprotein A